MYIYSRSLDEANNTVLGNPNEFIPNLSHLSGSEPIHYQLALKECAYSCQLQQLVATSIVWAYLCRFNGCS